MSIKLANYVESLSLQGRRAAKSRGKNLNRDYLRAVYNESIQSSYTNRRLAISPRHFLSCAYSETDDDIIITLEAVASDDVVDEIRARCLPFYLRPNEEPVSVDEIVEILEVEGLPFDKVVAPYPDYAVITFSNLEDWGKFIDSRAAEDFAVWWSRTEALMEVWLF